MIAAIRREKRAIMPFVARWTPNIVELFVPPVIVRVTLNTSLINVLSLVRCYFFEVALQDDQNAICLTTRTTYSYGTVNFK